MRHTRSRTAAYAAGCLALLAVAFTGCGGGGSSSSEGVTKTTITIGSHQPLTGPAAPGYSEIAPAAKAYFSYVNANGGVNGRKIDYIYKDDGYNPTNTVSVTKQLVLQNKVFAIFNGLGTPTHTKVLDYLNTQKVPDLFVASGCACWDDGSAHPWTFGWQTNYKIEGKILGQYLKQHFAGKKIAVFYQGDDFGKDGLAGVKQEIPASQIVTAQAYEPGNTNVGPQISAIQKSGAQVMVDFTVPAYTALGQLASFKLGYKPQLVVSNVGIDPTTVGGLLKAFSKGKAGSSLIEGLRTAYYLPSGNDASDPWIKMFKGIHDQYIPKLPWDGNVLYGEALAYTFAEALQMAGKSPTRQSIVDAIESGKLKGPGLVPFRYSKDSHAGFTGERLGEIKNGQLIEEGQPLVTDDGNGPIKPGTQPAQQPPPNGVPAQPAT
jgi:ABC-type branched-subunit amino acid transport system substrate-binding protein